MIDLIDEQFLIKTLETKLSFPVSALLFLVFSRDSLLPFLPSLIKIDEILC